MIIEIGVKERVMNLKETTLNDLNRFTNKVNPPTHSADYQYLVKAYALRLNRNYEESITCYEKALKIDKNNLEALKGISLCYKNLGKFDLAVKYHLQIKHLTPFDRAVHYELGVLEYDRKNYCKAIKNFINAIKLSPEYYDAIYALGQAHEALEEYEMAEMIYLKILENRPSYLLAYNKIANMYLKMEDYKKATRYFKELIAINPDFHRAYLGLAITFDRAGQPFDARRYYKKYLEIKPFSEEKEYVLDRIQKLRPKKPTTQSSRNHLALVKM